MGVFLEFSFVFSILVLVAGVQNTAFAGNCDSGVTVEEDLTREIMLYDASLRQKKVLIVTDEGKEVIQVTGIRTVEGEHYIEVIGSGGKTEIPLSKIKSVHEAPASAGVGIGKLKLKRVEVPAK